MVRHVQRVRRVEALSQQQRPHPIKSEIHIKTEKKTIKTEVGVMKLEKKKDINKVHGKGSEVTVGRQMPKKYRRNVETDIRKMQVRVRPCCSKKAFRRLVQSVVDEIGSKVRVSPDAVEKLHTASEAGVRV